MVVALLFGLREEPKSDYRCDGKKLGPDSYLCGYQMAMEHVPPCVAVSSLLPGDCPQPGLPMEAGYIGYKGLHDLLCSWLTPSALLKTGPSLPAAGSATAVVVPMDHCRGSGWLPAGSSLAILGSAGCWAHRTLTMVPGNNAA